MTDEPEPEPEPQRRRPSLMDAFLGGAKIDVSPAIASMLEASREVAAAEQAPQEVVNDRVRSMIRSSPEVRTASAAQATADGIRQLLEHALKSEEREQTMLVWARVAGIGAILAAAISAAAIIVTLLIT